jgi:hypothetical protein
MVNSSRSRWVLEGQESVLGQHQMVLLGTVQGICVCCFSASLGGGLSPRSEVATAAAAAG